MNKEEEILQQLKLLNENMSKLIEINSNLFRLFNQYNSEYHESFKEMARVEDS
jgi:hypothetical protein